MALATKTYRKVLSAGTLTGDRVVNPQNESLGKLEEIMIDLDSGRIAYCVLSFGGILGFGDKLFAIPWQAFQVDEDKKQLILNVKKDVLERAPGFDKDNWPDMTDPSWGTSIFKYYGYRPYWE